MLILNQYKTNLKYTKTQEYYTVVGKNKQQVTQKYKKYGIRIIGKSISKVLLTSHEEDYLEWQEQEIIRRIKSNEFELVLSIFTVFKVSWDNKKQKYYMYKMCDYQSDCIQNVIHYIRDLYTIFYIKDKSTHQHYVFYKGKLNVIQDRYSWWNEVGQIAESNRDV